jgi:hypothetical protein
VCPATPSRTPVWDRGGGSSYSSDEERDPFNICDRDRDVDRGGADEYEHHALTRKNSLTSNKVRMS